MLYRISFGVSLGEAGIFILSDLGSNREKKNSPFGLFPQGNWIFHDFALRTGASERARDSTEGRMEIKTTGGEVTPSHRASGGP